MDKDYSAITETNLRLQLKQCGSCPDNIENTCQLRFHNEELRREIAERKRAQAALLEAQAQQKAILDNIPDMAWLKDRNGRYLAVNEAFSQACGSPSAEVVGKTDADIWPSDLAERYRREDAEVMRTGGRRRMDEPLMLQPSDELVWIETIRIAIVDQAANIAGTAGIARDVTEQRMSQASASQAQKMEAIGRLAAGIAHEINTPTQYVGDNLRFLQDSFEGLSRLIETHRAIISEAARQGFAPELTARAREAFATTDLDFLLREIPPALEQGLEGVQRVARIVRAMRDFSHPGIEEKVMVDMNRAIDSTSTVARAEWKYVAEMRLELDPDLPPVPCHPGDINQVLLNMIVNAAHAIAEVIGENPERKGTITIRTKRQGEWAEIRIADTGAGIPLAIQGRIYDPFFTTKGIGKGTGQGLAIAHNVIVNKHRGAIFFETAKGRGTTFVIRLPLSRESDGRESNEEDDIVRG